MKRSSLFNYVVLFVSLFVSCAFALDGPKESYFKGIELASQGNLQEAKDVLSYALSDESLKPFAQLEINAIDDALNGKVTKEIAARAFKGKLYAIEKKWDQAISEYYKVIEYSPSFVYAYISRGSAFLETKSYGKAVDDFSEALKLDPNNADVYIKRGVAYQWKGNIDKAIKDYSSAIEINAGSALYYCNRGRAYYVKGKSEEALADLEMAIKLDPDYLDAYLVKGWTCEDLMRNEEAISAYKKVIELDSSENKYATKEAEGAIKDLESRMLKESNKKTSNDSKKNK
ncbi:MAG: tetratricopeptide repeat protein [Candidatus Omnitrophota bacterium]|jgi:tetratricopeptide (TPR) repeat protein